jgi:hypothetical protein
MADAAVKDYFPAPGAGDWTSLRSFHAERWNIAHVLFALGMPGIVSGLHANPDSRAVAEQLAEPNRNGWRDWLALAQDIIEVLAGNTEKLRNLRLRLAGRGNHIFPQQGAGMGRTPVWIALGGMSHDDVSSVILFEVDPARVAVLEFEGDAPRSVHMDRIARRLEAPQGIEIEPGDVHFLRPRGDIQAAIETTKNTLLHPRVDLGRSPAFPKLRKGLALEAPDHDCNM